MKKVKTRKWELLLPFIATVRLEVLIKTASEFETFISIMSSCTWASLRCSNVFLSLYCLRHIFFKWHSQKYIGQSIRTSFTLLYSHNIFGLIFRFHAQLIEVKSLQLEIWIASLEETHNLYSQHKWIQHLFVEYLIKLMTTNKTIFVDNYKPNRGLSIYP